MERHEYPLHRSPGSQIPSPAGIWSYWTGEGMFHSLADKAAGEAFAERYPELAAVARHSRAFQRKVVAHMTGAVQQIIDIGTGLPLRVNTHDMAVDDVTVVYVDNDPTILAYARAQLVGDHTAYIDADLTDPDYVLRHAAQHIDLSQPTGVLLLSTLGLINPPGEAAAIVQHYTARLATGSMLAVADTLTSPEVKQAEAEYAATGTTPYIARTRAEIAETAAGMEILPPGIVPVTQWGTGSEEPSQQYGYLARKP